MTGGLGEIRHFNPACGEWVAEDAPPGTVIGDGIDSVIVSVEADDFTFHRVFHVEQNVTESD